MKYPVVCENEAICYRLHHSLMGLLYQTVFGEMCKLRSIFLIPSLLWCFLQSKFIFMLFVSSNFLSLFSWKQYPFWNCCKIIILYDQIVLLNNFNIWKTWLYGALFPCVYILIYCRYCFLIECVYVPQYSGFTIFTKAPTYTAVLHTHISLCPHQNFYAEKNRVHRRSPANVGRTYNLLAHVAFGWHWSQDPSSAQQHSYPVCTVLD